MTLIIILCAVILIWLAIVTYFVFTSHGRRNTNTEEDASLNTSKIADINKRVSFIESENLKHIQKVGMVRFNPFNETGGDNSFTICLLDGNSDGVLITGLHTREKTRIYSKKVVKGKSSFELSKEEQAAIHEALLKR